MRGRPPRLVPGVQVAVCIVCACDDLHACEGAFGEGCSWARVDRSSGLGICSECVSPVAAINRQRQRVLRRLTVLIGGHRSAAAGALVRQLRVPPARRSRAVR